MTVKCARAALVMLVVILGAGIAAEASAAQSVVWLTRPSDLRQLSFLRAGIIKETFVEEGDTVKAGQLLMRQDDSVEQQTFKKLNYAANDDVRIRFQEIKLAQTRVDYKKYEKAFGNGSVTTTELEHSRLQVQGDEASLDIVKLEQNQAITDRDQMKATLDQMRLVSPIDGRVERLVAREGVASQALDMVVAVICTDPLWADMPVSFDQAVKLKVGDTVKVKLLQGNGGQMPMTSSEDSEVPADAIDAKIIYKATMADLAGKITIRIEFPNPKGVPSGGHVRMWMNTDNKTGE